MKKFESFSEGETKEIGRKLGQLLSSGDVLCLNGDLGTGKTAFTNGLANGMGIGEYITSPTFTIVNEYKGRLPLYHFDAYRIADSEEMFEIGFDEYLNGTGVVVIEWADLIKPILPEKYIRVDIQKDIKSDINKRIITIHFVGRKYEDYEARLS